MRTCEACGARIYFGRGRFCSESCQASGFDSTFSQRIPLEVARDRAIALHAGRCPRCNGPGPVDMRLSYRGWSAVYASSWESRFSISCHRCGVQQQFLAIIYTAILGWWSITGLLMTPVQVARNIAVLLNPPDPTTPSEALVARVRVQLGAQPLI